MRVRDHVALSTASAVLISRWSRFGAIGFWTGSVLIDADHYAWFCARHRRANPIAAVRLFHQAHAPQHPSTRVLHSPAALLVALFVGMARRPLLAVAAGMALHVALDAHHESRMDEARKAALGRDRSSCQGCGARGSAVETHVAHQPWLLPAYGPENLISLCGSCHEAAHARAEGSRSWR